MTALLFKGMSETHLRKKRWDQIVRTTANDFTPVNFQHRIYHPKEKKNVFLPCVGQKEKREIVVL